MRTLPSSFHIGAGIRGFPQIAQTKPDYLGVQVVTRAPEPHPVLAIGA